MRSTSSTLPDRMISGSWLSLRNLPNVHLIASDQLNTYDVLVNDVVLFTSASLEAFLAGPVAQPSRRAAKDEEEAQ